MKSEKLIKTISLILIVCLLVARAAYSKWEEYQMVPEGQQENVVERDENTVIWNIGRYWERDEDFVEYFNALLQKYGCPYRVEFQLTMIADEVYGDQGVVEPYAEDFFESADIITLIDNSLYAHYYDYYGYKGELLALDDLLKTDSGLKLYDAYPEIVWESSRLDGKIYGVSSDWMNRTCYLIVNKSYLKIDEKSNMPNIFEEWLDLIDAVAEIEHKSGNQSFLGMLASVYSNIPESYNFFAESPIRIIKDEGLLRAESIFANEAYVSFLTRLNKSAGNGFMSYAYQAVEKGNFGAAIQYSYSEEAAIGEFREKYNCPKETPLTAVELPELEQLYDGNGVKTVISAKSDRGEMAFQVLALCLSEPELSNALFYGREGVEYVLEDGKVVFLENYSELLTRWLGNPFLIHPMQREPINRSELLQEQYENIKESPLMSFRFDITSVTEEWGNVMALSGYEYTMLWSGIAEDLKQNLIEAEKKLKEAGLETVLKEVNRQIEVWQQENGGT